MVLSALLFSAGRFSPSRFSLDTGWTTPSLSQPNSNVHGSIWKLSDGAAMSDAMIDAIAAPRFSLSLQVTSGERNEAFALPLVASSGLPDPEPRAGGRWSVEVRTAKLAPVLLVLYAAESDLKGHVSIARSSGVSVCAELLWKV